MGNVAEKLAKKLSVEKEKTLLFWNELPEEYFDDRLYEDGAEWTVKEVLAHIVDAEKSLTQLFVHISEGGSGVGPDFNIDEYNKIAVEDFDGVVVSELLEKFVEFRDNLINTIKKWDDAQFENIGRHPFLGEARLDQMIRLFYLHVNLHIRDVRKLMNE